MARKGKGFNVVKALALLINIGQSFKGLEETNTLANLSALGNWQLQYSHEAKHFVQFQSISQFRAFAFALFKTFWQHFRI